jgi:hypothetical protein
MHQPDNSYKLAPLGSYIQGFETDFNLARAYVEADMKLALLKQEVAQDSMTDPDDIALFRGANPQAADPSMADLQKFMDSYPVRDYFQTQLNIPNPGFKEGLKFKGVQFTPF